MNATPVRTRQEFLDLAAAMDRGAIPDHQQPRPEVSNQVFQKLHRMQTVQRLLTHEEVHLGVARKATHDGQMVTGLPLPNDRGFCLWQRTS